MNKPQTVFLTSIGADRAELEVSLWINDLQNGRQSLISKLYRDIGMALAQADIALAEISA